MRLEQYIKKGSFYKAVVEDGSDLIFVVDYSGNICYHNSSVGETLGYKSKSLAGKNFFDYINTHRTEEFKKLVSNPNNRKFTLLSLAFECGFNSKSSFNKYFKKVTGQSPSEYLQHLNVEVAA